MATFPGWRPPRAGTALVDRPASSGVAWPSAVIQDWVQVQATVLKSNSKYLDIFQLQVQVQSLCNVLKSKSKYKYFM